MWARTEGAKANRAPSLTRRQMPARTRITQGASKGRGVPRSQWKHGEDLRTGNVSEEASFQKRIVIPGLSPKEKVEGQAAHSRLRRF